jgi:hypothetical protein
MQRKSSMFQRWVLRRLRRLIGATDPLPREFRNPDARRAREDRERILRRFPPVTFGHRTVLDLDLDRA